jgi:hypothetical protein
MIFFQRYISVAFIFSWLLFSACSSTGKNACNDEPRTLTSGIYFYLKDRATGNDILNYGASILPAPDSIRLKNAGTGQPYPLYVTKSNNGSVVFSQFYNRPAGVVDSLEFRFGSAVPDTLIIYTGLINGWRGDECPTVKDAGITKVILRNVVLVETTNDDSFFTITK